MTTADLAAIVARDREQAFPTAKAQLRASFKAVDDRRALLALVGELAHALGSVGECHGCIHAEDHAEEWALLASVDAVR
jgi:hypothetical protein